MENNTIERARNGITVHRLSFAIIVGNTIQDNLENGIPKDVRAAFVA